MSSVLRIINITDVYKLDNFANLKNLIIDKKKEADEKYNGGCKTISILTGDFLAPYLLSSVDKGIGMTKMLNSTPIDYVIFGNHEDDLEHKFVCKRIQEYKGVWINTNMQNHEQFKDQKAYEIIEISNKNGENKHKIGLIGVLSDSESLYRKGCFGGATIKDPYECIAEYKEKLENEENCDLVLPLCHLYVPQDKITCERFNFPVILSGHDHHVVNEDFFGTRLLKAGANGEKAVILDLIYNENDSNLHFEVEIVNVKDWKADEELQKETQTAMSVLDKLENTEICKIPEKYRPLYSKGSRSKDITIAHFLFEALRNAMNKGINNPNDRCVDAVIMAGGEIRGGKVYPDNCKFSLKDLRDEIQEELEFIIVPMSGQLIIDGVKSTHNEPNPGYMQFDGGVTLDDNGNVKTIHDEPIDKDKIYKIATTLWSIKDSGAKQWEEYFNNNPNVINNNDHPVASTILSYFAEFVWKKVFESLDTNSDGILSKDELKAIDTDGDGRISKPELAAYMKKLGWDVDENEVSFVDCIFEVAGDINKDGYLSDDEINKSK